MRPSRDQRRKCNCGRPLPIDSLIDYCAGCVRTALSDLRLLDLPGRVSAWRLGSPFALGNHVGGDDAPRGWRVEVELGGERSARESPFLSSALVACVLTVLRQILDRKVERRATP